MATISSGSVTITINAGEQYRFVASGEAYLDIGGGSTQSYRLINGASERLLGGFIVATPVTVRVVSGSVDYAMIQNAVQNRLTTAQLQAGATGVAAVTESGEAIGFDGTKLPQITLPEAALIIGSLQAKASAVISIVGDSTGVNSTPTETPTRWFLGMIKNIGAILPDVCIMYKAWDPASQDYLRWYVAQEGALGQRYVQFTGSTGYGRQTRSQKATSVGDISGDIDVRVCVDMDSWMPASDNTLIARMGEAGSRGWRMTLRTTGNIDFVWHANPASETTRTITATSAKVAGVTGTKIYLRATVDIDNGSSGYTANIYKSSDGVTWNNIATSTVAGVTTIGNPTGIDYQIGGRDTNVEMCSGKFYEATIRQGIGGQVITYDPIEAWSAYRLANTSGMVGGSPTLYVFNGSHGGGNLDYFNDATRLPMMVRRATPSVIYLNTGHNEDNYRGLEIVAKLDAWKDAVNVRNPLSNIIVCMQNPELNKDDVGTGNLVSSHANARTREIGAWALRNGLSVQDNGAAIGSVSNLGDYMSSYASVITDVYPNQLGYDVMADDATKPYKVAARRY